MAAEEAISSAVERLGELLIKKEKIRRDVEGEVELLKEELIKIQRFLEDANRKQVEGERVNDWISKIRDLGLDIEDTIIKMSLLNNEIAKNRNHFLKRCIGFWKRKRALNKIGDEIKSIRARLDDTERTRERYGIRDLGTGFEVTEDLYRRYHIESWRRLAPWQTDKQLVGIEGDVEKLLQEAILDEKKGLSVAVIHGMGGIGKSALAREIYNHPDVIAGPFECRGWVVVSSEFTPQDTIKQLIFQLFLEDKQNLLEEMKKLEESMKDKQYLEGKLIEMLSKQLEGKSYFVVLDDVWENEHLESLITAFPNQQDKRSRLLVTTRNNIITKYDQYVHKMRLLDPGKSWELLLKAAFIGKCPGELESIGRQILQKCDGLPLAICLVGGLLRETQTKSSWEQVLNQMDSYLGNSESNISMILELSYQCLSLQLKSCFLCVTFFKEDSIIPAQRLINTWVGMDLIKQQETATIDEIGRGYLNELINRSMLQVDDFINDDQVKNCRLHNLLRELSRREAHKLRVEIVNGEEGDSFGPSSKTRHRVVYGKNLVIFTPDQNRYLRSLFLLNVSGEDVYVSTRSDYWKKFQLLKILDLDGFGFRTLPDSFRFLVGLKCLRIRRDRLIFGCFILKLPSWFDQLKELEVLDLEKELVFFPDVALKMEKLRRFRVYLVDGNPMSIDNWESIETSNCIRLKDWMEISSRLMDSSHLRELGIYIGGIEEYDMLCKGTALLEKMTNLVELHLEFGDEMLKCPAASVFPPNLSHLVLANLNDDPMEELGKLPNLQYLTLSNRKYHCKGSRMKVLHNGFPCLKALSLQNMSFLRRIDIEEGGMAFLKQLEIIGCRKLETENLPKHISILVA